MEEGTFAGWLKAEGDTVKPGDPLFTLDGDKALQEVEATDGGRLHIPASAPASGTTVRVGDLLGYLVAPGELPPGDAARTPPAASRPASEATAPVPPTSTPVPEPVSAPIPSIKASPRAIRAAAAAGVDLSQVRGTGKSGRIREKDVLAAQGAARPAPTAVGTRFSLQGKVTLVTGAGSGIGAAIAEAFVRAGALVYVADINAEAAQAQVRRLAGGPGVAKATALDVSDGPACEKLVKQILVSNGRCDVLVNNAGVGHVGTVLTTSPSDLERLWAVNVRGMYQLCRAVLPSMVERRSGSIINLASVIGLTAMEDRFAYTVTKHAVVGLTRSIALDFGTTGVRVNCICPGRVETPFVEARLREYPDPEKYRAQMVAPHALKRMAQPWEIASAALYLASDDSAFVTGSTLVVDGGYLCGK